MNKGILHEIEKGKVNAMKPLTVESFREFCKQLNSMPTESPILYLSEDSSNYLTAHLTGNKAEVDRLDKKHSKEAKERLEATHKRVISKYGQDYLFVFMELDTEYGRNPFADDEWLVKRVYLEDEEFDSYDIVVTLEDKFVVTKTYSDETGYFTKRVTCIECEHDEVFDVVKELV